MFNENKPSTYESIETYGGGAHVIKRTLNFTYYCFDVVIKSATEVEFRCYDMYNTATGGRGEFTTAFGGVVDKSVTQKFIDKRLMDRAINRRVRELDEIEMAICAGYAEDERKVLGL